VFVVVFMMNSSSRLKGVPVWNVALLQESSPVSVERLLNDPQETFIHYLDESAAGL